MEVLASRYELLEEIKNDAGRTLFRAHDMQLDRKVALKIVELDDTPARDELLGEVKILLRLEAHAALPYMREGFALDDEHFVIVMDWVDGQNLADVLDQQGSPGLTSKAVVQYVLQAAAALDHLHTHEPPIVHGDVKPSNLVLTPSGKVVLVDFGIAHQAGASVDAGTRGYVAPEVWRGEPSSPAADIFGLAATAYALLSGAPPDHRRPPDLDPDPVVARVMDGALRQALATDPSRRPRTAVEFADRFAASSRALPEGIVTFMSIMLRAADEFLYSEDEDIAALRDRVGDALGAAIEEQGGRWLGGGIDSDRLDAVFTSASSAAVTALALHQRVAGLRVPSELSVSLQVALHTGEAVVRGGRYSGPIVSRVHRLAADAGPRTTVVSPATAILLEDRLPMGARLVPCSDGEATARYLLLGPGEEPPDPVSTATLPPVPDAADAGPTMPAASAATGAPGANAQLDEMRAQLAKWETLADVALRRAHEFRQGGDAVRADEFEHNAAGYAAVIVRLRREIEVLERG